MNSNDQLYFVIYFGSNLPKNLGEFVINRRKMKVLRNPCRFATLNAGNTGGVTGGKLGRFVQALDCGAGAGVF